MELTNGGMSHEHSITHALNLDELTAVLNGCREAVAVFDDAFHFLFLNAEAERFLGRLSADLIGKNLWENFPDAKGAFFNTLDHAMRSGIVTTFGANYAANELKVEGRCVPIRRSPDHGSPALAVFFRDTTQERRAETALHTSEERLRLAVDGAEIGTWHWDIPNNKLFWSDTTRVLLGLPHVDTPTYDMFMQAMHPDDRERTNAAVTAALQNKSVYDTEYRAVWPDGSVHWHISRGRCYYNADGVAYRMEGILIDITERKRAEQQLRAWGEREALIGRIGAAIRHNTDPIDIQQAAASLLGDALRADRCFYATYDPFADVLHCRADYHRDDLSTAAGEYPLSAYRSVLDQFFAQGTAVVCDTRLDLPANIAAIYEGFGQRSTLAVPLFTDNAFAAALFVTMMEPRYWTPEEVTLAEQVATMTRTALEAARVSRKEHEIAERLQAALQPALPETMPGLNLAHHYRPALDEAEVGGDFADVFPDERGATFLVVGDLAGKGLAAASQVAAIRSMLRYALYNTGELSEAITNLNRTVTQYDLLSGFATLFVGCYQANTRSLTYVNCGQESGVLVRASTRNTVLLSPTGPVVGMSDTAMYMQETIVLEPRDVVAIFTDGLTEIGPSRRELLGNEGTAAFVAAHSSQDARKLREGVMASVTSYSGGVVRDDQCLLVAVVTD